MSQNDMNTPPAARILFGVFGLVFFGIGLTVVIFLWSDSGWGAPPLFFRVFGSLIALAFVAFGGTMAVAALTGGMGGLRPRLPGHPRADVFASPPVGAGGYACPQCGAALAKEAEVSPLGDVKCTFCGSWFNIHGRR